MTSTHTDVPPEQSPTAVCGYCGTPFSTTDRLVLHKGLEHAEALTEQERDAFVDARAAEEDDLQTLRLKALGMLVLVYFGFLSLYAIFA